MVLFGVIGSDHFPYFRSAPPGWKNSVRHNLSLNKVFTKTEKLDMKGSDRGRKGYLWSLSPDDHLRRLRMEKDIIKIVSKKPPTFEKTMSDPGNSASSAKLQPLQLFEYLRRNGGSNFLL